MQSLPPASDSSKSVYSLIEFVCPKCQWHGHVATTGATQLSERDLIRLVVDSGELSDEDMLDEESDSSHDQEAFLPDGP